MLSWNEYKIRNNPCNETSLAKWTVNTDGPDPTKVKNDITYTFTILHKRPCAVCNQYAEPEINLCAECRRTKLRWDAVKIEYVNHESGKGIGSLNPQRRRLQNAS